MRFCGCAWKGQIFFSLSPVVVKLLPLLSKSFKVATLLAVLTRTGEGCGPRKSHKQHKILAGIRGGPQFAVFESLSKKLHNMKGKTGLLKKKSIAGSFELLMYKVLMKMSLRGVLIVDFEISFTAGLITLQSI